MNQGIQGTPGDEKMKQEIEDGREVMPHDRT